VNVEAEQACRREWIFRQGPDQTQKTDEDETVSGQIWCPSSDLVGLHYYSE
jgi:hypothetical protein